MANPDDPTATRALWWTIFALVLAVAATVFLLLKAEPGDGRISANTSARASSGGPEIPFAKFTDITADANIRFSHHNGAYGEKLLPETMGAGVAFLDFDNDGQQDLLFVNSTNWPGKAPEQGFVPTMALYRNLGNGRFDDVTAGSGLDREMYGVGVAAGDYDNDGRVDLFITGVGGNRLFHNEGAGKFRDVTIDSGISSSPDQWSTSAAWIDYDHDGRLDLFVCNYVQWSPEIDRAVDYKLPGVGRAYGPPERYQGTLLMLFRNEESSFRDISAEAGIHVINPATKLPVAKSLGVAPVDVDGDGWMDLIVANDTVPNFVFHNQRGTGFREVGELSGAAFDEFGKARGAMGIDAARFGEDQRLGIAIGNFANEMTAFYVSQRESMAFTDEAISRGIGGASRPYLTFGVFFFDYDLDGRLDLLTTNGHIENQISHVQPSQQYAQPAQLFWNAGRRNGGPAFTPVPPEKAGEDLFRPIVGRGSAYADIDGDGDLDVVMTQVNGAPLLLRNDQNLNRHWLRLKLMGTRSNRDAIGAWVKVRSKDRVLWRQVMPTRSYLSQSELPVTIGLGKERSVDEITVIWPRNRSQSVAVPAVDTLFTVVEEQ